MFIGLGFGYIAKSIVSLAIVLLLVNLLLKKLNQTMAGQHRTIQVIERTAVGKNSSLAVTKVGEKYYLMSFSESGNTILKELDEEEIMETSYPGAKQSDLTVDQSTDQAEKKPDAFLSMFLKEIRGPKEKRMEP